MAYQPPIVTVDGVIFQLIDNQLQVLLIERQKEPFQGHRVLPGGYVSQTETTTQALDRVLAAKAGIYTRQIGLTEQLYTFDTPAAQDPRGHAVSVVYYALAKHLEPLASQTTELPAFFPLNKLPALAYQHKDIIDHALQRLRSKVMYSNAMFALLPTQFTLSQLQDAYQAVLGRELDKRNFRKKFMALDLIEATPNQLKQGAHRPAQLYSFKHQHLYTLSRSFD